MEISFKTAESTESKTVQFDFPTDLQGLVDTYGAESVYDNAIANYKIGLQAYCRRHYEKPVNEIQALVDNWNPNERSAVTKLSPFERATRSIGNLSDEEKAELLRRLTGG